MTRRSKRDSIVSRIRWSGALAALVALTALVAIGPPGNAGAATGTGYDQITGAGSTNSAVTVSWAQGLLDSNNQPITAANAVRSNPTGPLSFMYQDPGFNNLQVTVSQTQNITHQGITISWKGGGATIRSPGNDVEGNFLQIMECYGDSSSGPSPQDCQFGSGGHIPGTAQNPDVGTRAGALCAVDQNGNTLPASTSNPPRSLDGSSAVQGCDPEEPLQGASPPDIAPGNSSPDAYTVPFVPVSDPSSPAYSFTDLSQYFNQFTTNEVAEAVTNKDGTGQLQFETLTGTEAPGLGCGQLENNGQSRNCWLVIVPRGQYEPNGFQINSAFATSVAGYIDSSPLSASNWAMRIQIHLGFAPQETFCPIGTKELQTVGTQVIARAVQSWQLALNKAANCARIYGYSAVPEATSTQQLALQGSGVGLAFTTIPIGSEAARNGGSTSSASLPPILYAPIAVSAEGFGFNINQADGSVTTPVKLTPELLASALTQVYSADLPDYYPNPAGPPTDSGIPNPGPAWSVGNPLNISQAGQFQSLNPEVLKTTNLVSLAPLLTEDHSAFNQQIWQWIQSDSAASAWLNQGTPDAANSFNFNADPDYLALKLGAPPAIDSFPRAYTGVLDLGQCQTCSPPKPIQRHSLDLLPYVNNYDQAAVNVLTANNPVTIGWDSQAVAPDGSLGWWDKNPPETIGRTFVWGISDTPDLAAYGLTAAQLCSDSGSSCVGLSSASLTTALDSAKPDSTGLLQVNPADVPAGGYPLTEVTYAAVSTSQSPADLTADADLIAYAAGAGQTPGVLPGDLPPGYLPLPASLQAQANAVVARLRADASPSPSSSSTSSPSTGTATSSTSGGGIGTTSLTPSPGGSVSSASQAGGPSFTPPHAELAAQTTRPQPVGAIRWLLLAVVTAGAACAVSGTVLSAGSARWLRRMRP